MPASTVQEYLDTLPPERRPAVERLRAEILAHLPAGYQEGIQYGGIGYYVPHALYPFGYHCDRAQPVPFVGIVSQKSHIGLYLFCIYLDPELTAWFMSEYAKTGKKLDMGKGCVRFKKPEEIPFQLVGQTVARAPMDAFLAHYEAGLPESAKKALTKFNASRAG